MNDHEQSRLYALQQLNLLDTPPSESFDRITRMASQFFDLPIAAVSLTDADRQWFKSRVGVDHTEIPRVGACCAEVCDDTAPLVVTDLLASETYRDSHLAQKGIRFYAGAPLVTREGFTLGAMCVLGTEPRQTNEQELSVLRDLAAMVMTQIELQHAFGRTDPLTGLPNRSQFSEDLEDMTRDNAGAERVALLTELVDVSELSNVRRVMGPGYLDNLARAAAQHLKQALRPGTTLYHLTPWQFVHIIEPGKGVDLIHESLRLRAELADLNVRAVSNVMLDPVVGVAPFMLGSVGPEDVLRMAHSACQDAREGESGAGFYSAALDAEYQRRFTLLNDFTAALEASDQLRLVYQPRVALPDGRCRGAEALLRWHHPALGEISPAEFIPLLENSPLARPLTDWVVKTAVAQAEQWHRLGLDLCISVNVSAANLEEEDFAARVLSRMRRVGLPVDAIELELTESALISNSAAAREQLDALVEAGIEVAIDDFGTGYSSLFYLQQIPAHIVKIDRSFISHLDTDERGRVLVKSMISMAHDLDYRVVGEGVETHAAYSILADMGCDEVQGYLVAKPLEVEAFEAWLEQSPWGRQRPETKSATTAEPRVRKRLSRLIPPALGAENRH